MSKPPSKSGGYGRGRPSGGASRDGSSYNRSSFGDSARGRSNRSDSSRDGSGSRYNSSGARGESPRGSSRGPARGHDFRNTSTPHAGQYAETRPKHERREPTRDVAPRNDQPRSGGGERFDGPREGARDRNREGAQRGERPRDNFGRDGGSRFDGPRGGSGSYSRTNDSRDSGSRYDQSSRGGFNRDRSRDDRGPRSDRGGRDSRDGFARPTYSRGIDRDDRRGFGDTPRGPRAMKPTREAPRAAAPTPKDPTLPAREGERIAKLLARAGVASRREVERMIIDGRVMIGEDVVQTPSTVLTSLQGVTVDGNPVADAEGTRLFLFHKPAGLLTAERDFTGRPTIYTALRNAMPEGSGRVMPIGRLDLSTEGLLLLTNDGEFKRKLELPATGIPRTYRARTFGDITQSRLEELMEGIEVEGVVYGKIDANMERRTGRNQWIEMTLTEGKNREVRRVLEALGLQVSRLIRTSYGPFHLGELPKGGAVEATQQQMENFNRFLSEMKA